MEQIKPEHKEILDKIRELYIEADGKPYHEPEDWGLNGYVKSKRGIEITFDYGIPEEMLTPDGYYVIFGSNICGNVDKFWELFTREFEIEIVTPKRDDSKTSELKYQTRYSGPTVRIKNR